MSNIVEFIVWCDREHKRDIVQELENPCKDMAYESFNPYEFYRELKRDERKKKLNRIFNYERET